MRVTFPNVVRPKKAAKRLHALTAKIPLYRCQAAIAAACGYRDWHDLETCGVGQGSPFDQDLSLAELGDRSVFQAEAIAQTLKIYYGDAKWALPQLHLSGDWSWDEYLLTALPRARSGISVVSREEFARRPFAMSGFRLHELDRLKEEGPEGRQWDGAPDRVEGNFPFPSEARAHISKIVGDFEAEEDVPVLQAAWSFSGEHQISIRLQYGYVQGNRIVESDPIRFSPIDISSLSWRPDQTAAIVPASLSPSYFADRPKISALLLRTAAALHA
jgi:hypothetical protein